MYHVYLHTTIQQIVIKSTKSQISRTHFTRASGGKVTATTGVDCLDRALISTTFPVLKMQGQQFRTGHVTTDFVSRRPQGLATLLLHMLRGHDNARPPFACHWERARRKRSGKCSSRRHWLGDRRADPTTPPRRLEFYRRLASWSGY